MHGCDACYGYMGSREIWDKGVEDLFLFRRIGIVKVFNYRPQQSCGQGYVFTRVCDSVHRGGLQKGRTPPDQADHPPRPGRPPRARQGDPPPPGGRTPQARQGEPPHWTRENTPPGPGRETPLGPGRETPPWDQADHPPDQGDPPGPGRETPQAR